MNRTRPGDTARGDVRRRSSHSEPTGTGPPARRLSTKDWLPLVSALVVVCVSGCHSKVQDIARDAWPPAGSGVAWDGGTDVDGPVPLLLSDAARLDDGAALVRCGELGSAPVEDLVFSPGGSYFIARLGSGEFEIRNTADGAVVRKLGTSVRGMRHLSWWFADDGRLALIVERGGAPTLVSIDTADDRQVGTVGLTGLFHVSPSGELLVESLATGLRARRARDGSVAWQLPRQEPWTAAFAPGGAILVARPANAQGQEQLAVVRANDGAVLWNGPPPAVGTGLAVSRRTAVASPSGDAMAVLERDQFGVSHLGLFRLPGAQPLWGGTYANLVDGVFSDDGRWFVLVEGRGGDVREAAGGSRKVRFAMPDDLEFGPGDIVATSAGDFLVMRNLERDDPRQWVVRIADGRRFDTGPAVHLRDDIFLISYPEARVWQIGMPIPGRSLGLDRPLAMSRDKVHLVGHRRLQNELARLDLPDGGVSWVRPLPPGGRGSTAVEVSGNGKVMAVTSEDGLDLWDAETRTFLRRSGHPRGALSSDGTLMVSADSDMVEIRRTSDDAVAVRWPIPSAHSTPEPRFVADDRIVALTLTRAVDGGAPGAPGSFDQEVLGLRASDGGTVWRVSLGGPQGCCLGPIFARAGGAFAVTTPSGVRVHDTRNGTVVGEVMGITWMATSNAGAMLSGDGRRLVISDGSRLFAVDFATGAATPAWQAGGLVPHDVSMTGDFVVGYHVGGAATTGFLLSLADGRISSAPFGENGGHPRFVPGSRTIATGRSTGTVDLWCF